jgi:CubicO group peptidase (beta-lactamase class C family)
MIGLSLSLFASSCSVPPVTPTQDLNAFSTQLDDQMPQWLQQYHVPGVAVALVRNGGVVWSKGYGIADEARGLPITNDTVFQVASISKAVTAWGVMRLVEKGHLNLDAPVEEYLTRWHLPPSSYDAKGVTIRRLLSHSAGLSVQGYPGLPPEEPLPSLEESLSGNNGGAGSVRIQMEPGTQFKYSGGGYTLLQLVIEEVTGDSFSNFMQREVLDPLGMNHSSFEWRDDLRPATATGYSFNKKPYPNYLFTEKAAAGLYTTAPDLARFVAAEMVGPNGEPAGRGIIAPTTLTKMYTPVVQLQGMEMLLGESMGLGHFIETLPDGTKAISHGGGNQGWQLEFMTLPEQREGIVILTNSDRGFHLYTQLLGAWVDWLGIERPKIVHLFHTMHMIAMSFTGLLGFGLILRLWFFVRQVRTNKLKKRGLIVLILSTLLACIVAVGWWMVIHPILSLMVANQAIWLTLTVLCWCFCVLIISFLRFRKT